LQELDIDELKAKVADAGVFNEKELIVLYGKYHRKLSGEIRDHLRDRFSAMFEESVTKVESIPGIGEDYRTKAYRIWEFYQKKLCSGALAVICGQKIKTDIALVRDTLDAIEVRVSPELLAYLTKFGDWSDVVRIERLTSASSEWRSLLDYSHDTFTDEKAGAIYQLGKSRVGDLLDRELSAALRKSLAKIFPNSVFTSLSNDAIIAELDRKDDEYRILFALRCVESLSKERIDTILSLYIERETQRYYNSIHWLDLGASFPKRQAIAIVRREMQRRLT
jgi:hypothetical protein